MRAGRLLVLVVSVVVTLLAAAGAVSAATPVPSAESDFASRIAGERSSRGLGSLRMADDLVVVARRHAERMAARGEAYHNPSLTSEVEGWQTVGENVGRGADVTSIHDAFMASQTHRDQIVFPGYTEVGIGVVESAGSLYVVEVFRQPMAQREPAPAPALEPAPAPQPAPAPAPAPAPQPAPAPPAAPAAAEAAAPAAVEAAPPVEPTVIRVSIQSAGEPAPGPALGGAPASTELALPAPDMGPGEALTAREVLDAAPDVPPAVGIATGLLALVVGLQGLAVRRLGLA